jgi:DNA-binding LacI/PurR family transcriptional regulator
VAKKAGVSIGTVSNVINGRPTVSDQIRDRVLKIIRELNFRPQGHAQTLRQQQVSHKCIGFIVRKIDHPWSSAISTGVKHYANQKGYLVYVASTESKHNSEQEIVQSFVSKQVQGAIIAPALDDTVEIDHLFRLKINNFPFVMLEDVHGIQVNVLSIDNTEAISSAVKYLIKCGHTNIIHFAGTANESHTIERINAFRQVFSESAVKLRKDSIVSCGGELKDGYRVGIDYFSNADKNKFPMAVICFNDVVAFGLLSALKELDINVPNQVAVIGFDDIEMAKYWTPSLTTIGTSLFDMGEKAAEMLINIIESDKILPIQKITLHADLILRKTTCKLKRTPGSMIKNFHKQAVG